MATPAIPYSEGAEEGAFVTDRALAAYLAPRGVLTNAAGEAIGTWRIVRGWQTGTARMWQIEATVADVIFTGRASNLPVLFRARRKRGRAGSTGEASDG